MHKVPVDETKRGSKWPEQWPAIVGKTPYWLKSSQVGVYSDRLIRLVVEHGLGHLPFTEKQVITPTGSVYTGVDFCKKQCGISIVRRAIYPPEYLNFAETSHIHLVEAFRNMQMKEDEEHLKNGDASHEIHLFQERAHKSGCEKFFLNLAMFGWKLALEYATKKKNVYSMNKEKAKFYRSHYWPISILKGESANMLHGSHPISTIEEVKIRAFKTPRKFKHSIYP